MSSTASAGRGACARLRIFASIRRTTAFGNPAHTLRADVVLGKFVTVALTWKAPHVQGGGGVQTYQAYRVTGPTINATNFARRVLVGQTSTEGIVDTKPKAGETYTYFVIVRFNDGNLSGMSNPATAVLPRSGGWLSGSGAPADLGAQRVLVRLTADGEIGAV